MNTLSEDEFIAQCRKDSGANIRGEAPWSLLDALETRYMDGFSDGLSGDADTFGHFYRVHRWIVHTDSRGFHEIETHDTEEQAIRAFEKLDKEYSATFDVDEQGR